MTEEWPLQVIKEHGDAAAFVLTVPELFDPAVVARINTAWREGWERALTPGRHPPLLIVLSERIGFEPVRDASLADAGSIPV